MSVRLYDAHCHLQDRRLDSVRETIGDLDVAKWVVNGTQERDWPEVEKLAWEFPERVIPSFGLHPWYVKDASPRWRETLAAFVERNPGAGIGEIGLDRWMENPDEPAQEAAFLWQLDLAAKENRPVSIHCLKAWGRLLELLQNHARPKRGVLFHSYGGSLEMTKPFTRLGGYFSFCGYFLHLRKESVRETFRQIPIERFLVETDAPDQALPENLERIPLADTEGKRLNHPGNLRLIYEAAAELRGMPLEEFAARIEANFTRLWPGNPSPDRIPGTP